MNVRKRVLYQGRVQGVGFRYTAHGLAQRFRLGGYVKNLPDGQVELVAEGTAEDVERFLHAVARQMHEHIESHTEYDEPAVGLMTFEIES